VRSAAALLASVLFAPAVLAAPCIWFADANSIKQFNTADNSVSVEVALGNPRRLVMNDNDCSVWALRRSNGRLLKYDEAGTQVRNVNVTQLEPAIAEVLRVRLDPYDNSLWVTGDRRIAHLNEDANALLASFNAPAEIRRFRIGLDQKLWVLGKRKLWRFNRQGTLMEERLLDPVANHKHLAKRRPGDQASESVGLPQAIRLPCRNPLASLSVFMVDAKVTGESLEWPSDLARSLRTSFMSRPASQTCTW